MKNKKEKQFHYIAPAEHLNRFSSHFCVHTKAVTAAAELLLCDIMRIKKGRKIWK